MKNDERTGICHPCGLKHGTRRPEGAHTAWGGRCRWCGEYKSGVEEGGVTDPRHYGYPNEPEKEENDG